MIDNKITFKEEDITLQEAKNILDVFFDSKDKQYKKGLKEITPFEGVYFKSYFGRIINYFTIKSTLENNKEAFIYRLAFIEKTVKSNKDFFYLKGIINGESKIFFYLSRKSIKSKKNIFIDKMISLQKGIGRTAIKDLCNYYNIFNIVVEPSVYGIGFWEKISKEFKGQINITIRYI